MKSRSHIPSGRPPAFPYRGGGLFGRRDSVLHCEAVPLTGLAEKFGTPLYCYSATAIRERFRAFDRAFRGFPHTVCYSVKANSNLSLLRLLAKLGCGFDVVSGGELQRVLHVDRRAGSKVVFSGVGKTEEEMDLGLRAGIRMFNVESETELRLLAERAARLKKTAPVALRVNPDVPASTHPYIATGLHEHKFGVPIAEARELYRRAAREKSLAATGVSVHIGSQILDIEPFGSAMQRVAELVRELRSDGHKIREVDAGGGLGIFYGDGAGTEKDFAERAEAYAKALLRPLRKLDVHLLLEPGRAIVGPCGALLTRVLYRKSNGSKRFVVVDAGMNDLLRPSLYGAFHDIVPLERRADAKSLTFDVVGPVCETGDFFARDRRMQEPQECDLLAILDVGAYGMALASNYNTRLRPAEVLVKGRSVRLIRRRERFEDLISGE